MEATLNRILAWAWGLIWQYRHFLLTLLGLSILGIIVEKIFEIKVIRHIVIGLAVVVAAWLVFRFF